MWHGLGWQETVGQRNSKVQTLLLICETDSECDDDYTPNATIVTGNRKNVTVLIVQTVTDEKP